MKTLLNSNIYYRTSFICQYTISFKHSINTIGIGLKIDVKVARYLLQININITFSKKN